MEITIQRYMKIQELGLTSDWVLLLGYIQQRQSEVNTLMKDVRNQGMVQLLKKKNLLTPDGSLSELGGKTLQEVESVGVPSPVVVTKPSESTSPHAKIDLYSWCEGVIKKVRERLKEKTGKTNARGFQNKPFVPSAGTLMSVMIRYQKRKDGSTRFDLDKIEKMLLAYTDDCIFKKKYAPVLQYYILHEERGSDMAADYDSFEEIGEVPKEQGLINTKELFG